MAFTKLIFVTKILEEFLYFGPNFVSSAYIAKTKIFLLFFFSNFKKIC